MWYQFFLQNLYFALNILAALIMLWVFWLFFDVWLARRKLREFIKAVGFLFLAISFVVHGVHVESAIVSTPIISDLVFQRLMILTRISGYLLVAGSLFVEPNVRNPLKNSNSQDAQHGTGKINQIIPGPIMLSIMGRELPAYAIARFTFPLFAIGVAVLYLYKSTIGLEYHLRKVAYGFYFLVLYEFLNLRELFTKTTSVSVFEATKIYSAVWYLEQLILFVAVIIIGRWVFGYLLKRLETQLYMFFSLSVLIIFVVSTLTFTSLLLKNIQTEALKQLDTSSKVLEYAIANKQKELVSDAEVFVKDSRVIEAVKANSIPESASYSSNYLLTKTLSTLVITDSDGKIVARGEETERIGDSISGNTLVKRSLLGETTASLATRDGVLAPEILISSSVPVKDTKNELVGSVVAGVLIENAFLDGIEKATGLTASLFGGDKISATSLKFGEGKDRRIGTKETDNKVIEKVLTKGEGYTGESTLYNVPYFASYLPLKDIDATPVGMLFVGRTQLTVLQIAGNSLQFTFIIAGILWLIAIIPSYLISNYIAKQLH